MRKIFLDTNAYSAYRRGDERVLEALSENDRVFVSLFVIGELMYGFRGGNVEPRNRRELRSFLNKPTVRLELPTYETADLFGEIKEKLRSKGAPIPTNDLWIAAHCIELGARLITFDQHFVQVEGLRIWPHITE